MKTIAIVDQTEVRTDGEMIEIAEARSWGQEAVLYIRPSEIPRLIAALCEAAIYCSDNE